MATDKSKEGQAGNEGDNGKIVEVKVSVSFPRQSTTNVEDRDLVAGLVKADAVKTVSVEAMCKDMANLSRKHRATLNRAIAKIKGAVVLKGSAKTPSKVGIPRESLDKAVELAENQQAALRAEMGKVIQNAGGWKQWTAQVNGRRGDKLTAVDFPAKQKDFTGDASVSVSLSDADLELILKVKQLEAKLSEKDEREERMAKRMAQLEAERDKALAESKEIAKLKEQNALLQARLAKGGAKGGGVKAAPKKTASKSKAKAKPVAKAAVKAAPKAKAKTKSTKAKKPVAKIAAK